MRNMAALLKISSWQGLFCADIPAGSGAVGLIQHTDEYAGRDLFL